jgi:uncharacterized protein
MQLALLLERDMNPASADGLPLFLEQLWIYPVKSCAGLRLPRAELLATGLRWDRAWMVVDELGEFVSQREMPLMALVQPRFHLGQLELRAPGMRTLSLGLESVGARRRVRVWDDEFDAWDMGDAPALWWDEYLQPGTTGLRLVRFDPSVRRLSDLHWTNGVEAPHQFGDGFPVLVLSSAAVADLNRRLQVLGHPSVGVERFRPNMVLGGLAAHDEDRLSELRFKLDGEMGVVLKPVKPCARCSIPDIDPATGRSSPEVGDLLRHYRQDRRLMGAATFGMNAIVTTGAGATLTEGLVGEGRWSAWGD